MTTAIAEPTEKSEMRIMDIEAGDLKIKWSKKKPDEVDAARAAFDKAKKKGMLFYKLKRVGGRGKQVTEFDPDAERIVGMPALRGG